MTEIFESDFRVLEDFPLKWRWTDPKYNVLPPDTLASIKPFTLAKAKELLKISMAFADSHGLLPDHFEHIEGIDASVEADIVRNWLTDRLPANEEIIISWDQDSAVQVSSKVFCNYWDDFCYPASDSIIAWPLNETWALTYLHHEEFVFGSLR